MAKENAVIEVRFIIVANQSPACTHSPSALAAWAMDHLGQTVRSHYLWPAVAGAVQ